MFIVNQATRMMINLNIFNKPRSSIAFWELLYSSISTFRKQRIQIFAEAFVQYMHNQNKVPMKNVSLQLR